MQALITIKEILADVMLDIDDQSNSQFLRASRFVERGIGEINLFHGKLYTITKLDIDYNKLTAPLPSDYVRYVRIGVYNNKGQLTDLTINHKNVNIPAKDCSEETVDEVEYSDTSYRYGHRGGLSSYYECTINVKQHRIEFSTNLSGNDVYLVYISTGVNSKTLIPVIYRESLIAYTKWKMETDVRMKDYYKNEYYEEVEKLRDAQAPTLSEFIDAIYQSASGTAHR